MKTNRTPEEIERERQQLLGKVWGEKSPPLLSIDAQTGRVVTLEHVPRIRWQDLAQTVENCPGLLREPARIRKLLEERGGLTVDELLHELLIPPPLPDPRQVPTESILSVIDALRDWSGTPAPTNGAPAPRLPIPDDLDLEAVRNVAQWAALATAQRRPPGGVYVVVCANNVPHGAAGYVDEHGEIVHETYTGQASRLDAESRARHMRRFGECRIARLLFDDEAQRLQAAVDALDQWRSAERQADAAELANARTSRDAALDAINAADAAKGK